MGLLAIGCSIIRLRNIIYFNGQGDFTYVASMVPVWGAIESNAGIICGMFTLLSRTTSFRHRLMDSSISTVLGTFVQKE
jgi:hypothetical protein